MEFAKGWFSYFELKVTLMIYLFGTVLLLQSLFWLLFRSPIMSLDWIIEFKFINIFLAVFFVWIISGESN